MGGGGGGGADVSVLPSFKKKGSTLSDRNLLPLGEGIVPFTIDLSERTRSSVQKTDSHKGAFIVKMAKHLQ